MFSLIPLPANFIGNSLGYAGTLFDDFKVLIMLICGIGIALGIWRGIMQSKGVDDDDD